MTQGENAVAEPYGGAVQQYPADAVGEAAAVLSGESSAVDESASEARPAQDQLK